VYFGTKSETVQLSTSKNRTHPDAAFPNRTYWHPMSTSYLSNPMLRLVSGCSNDNYFVPGRGVKYCYQRACLSASLCSGSLIVETELTINKVDDTCDGRPLVYHSHRPSLSMARCRRVGSSATADACFVCLSFKGSRLWNRLPNDLTQVITPRLFQKKLKVFLISNPM